MASVRLLKKRIKWITADLLTDVILLSLFIDKAKIPEVQELAIKLNELELSMLRRANKVSDKQVPAKLYYAQLKKDLQEQWCEISAQLKTLSEHIKEEEH